MQCKGPSDENSRRFKCDHSEGARRSGLREAIVEAAERLFLERGFGSLAWTSWPGPERYTTMA
jgi:hypothetical protein